MDPGLQSLAVVSIADFLVGEGLDEDRLAEALELEDPFGHMAVALRPSLIAGCIYLYQGRLEESVRALEGVRAGVIERGEEGDLAFVASCLAWAECWHGRLDAAARFADEALQTSERLGSASETSLALAHGVLVYAYRGEIDRAREQARRALLLATETGMRNVNLWARWGLGVAGLTVGDPVAVHDALGPMVHLGRVPQWLGSGYRSMSMCILVMI